jgi:hypothetical protein
VVFTAKSGTDHVLFSHRAEGCAMGIVEERPGMPERL